MTDEEFAEVKTTFLQGVLSDSKARAGAGLKRVQQLAELNSRAIFRLASGWVPADLGDEVAEVLTSEVADAELQ